MNDQWFYIQQWKEKRWSFVGKELSFEEVKALWVALMNDIDNSSEVKPLAYVKKGNSYKVVVKEEDGWQVVVCNAMFLNGGNDQPLLVQRVENEEI